MQSSREAWRPYFCRSARGAADLEDFSNEVEGGWLPVLDVFHLPPLTGDVLVEVVGRKKSTSCSLDGWGWRELKALPPSWFDGLARILMMVEEEGIWPEGLLDAYIAMIPKSDGAEAFVCVACGLQGLGICQDDAARALVQVFVALLMPDVPRLWTLRNALLKGVDADVHLFVADVVKSFDTVDKGSSTGFWVAWGCLLGFGMPIFEYHAKVRLRFKLAAGLGEPWT